MNSNDLFKFFIQSDDHAISVSKTEQAVEIDTCFSDNWNFHDNL